MRFQASFGLEQSVTDYRQCTRTGSRRRFLMVQSLSPTTQLASWQKYRAKHGRVTHGSAHITCPLETVQSGILATTAGKLSCITREFDRGRGWRLYCRACWAKQHCTHPTHVLPLYLDRASSTSTSLPPSHTLNPRLRPPELRRHLTLAPYSGRSSGDTASTGRAFGTNDTLALIDLARSSELLAKFDSRR